MCIYIYRERERYIHIPMCVHTYIYIYIYTGAAGQVRMPTQSVTCTVTARVTILPLTGPDLSEGTTSAKRVAATRNYKHPCPVVHQGLFVRP